MTSATLSRRINVVATHLRRTLWARGNCPAKNLVWNLARLLVNSLRGDEKERLGGAAHVFPDWWTVDYLRSEWQAYPNATCERPASAEPLNPPCKAGRHWSTCAYEAFRKTIRAEFNQLPSTAILKNGAKERAFGKYSWAAWRALSEEEKYSWARGLVRDEDPVEALVRLRRCNKKNHSPLLRGPHLQSTSN